MLLRKGDTGRLSIEAVARWAAGIVREVRLSSRLFAAKGEDDERRHPTAARTPRTAGLSLFIF
jgi:hypothetical protein